MIRILFYMLENTLELVSQSMNQPRGTVFVYCIRVDVKFDSLDSSATFFFRTACLFIILNDKVMGNELFLDSIELKISN